MSITDTVAKALPLSIYSILTGEHREIQTMLRMLEASPDAIEAGKSTLFSKMKRELMSHSHAELETVYQTLEDRSQNKDLVENARKEHAEIEQFLIELAAMDTKNEQWKGALRQLKQKIDHHIEEEEGPFFAEMKKHFTDEEAKDLGDIFREAKEKEMRSFGS